MKLTLQGRINKRQAKGLKYLGPIDHVRKELDLLKRKLNTLHKPGDTEEYCRGLCDVCNLIKEQRQ